MSARVRVVLSATVVLAAVAGAALGIATGGGFADALFLAVVAGALAATAWWAARWMLAARRERALAREAVETPDAELVARAVDAERARLALDIDRELRSRLTEIAGRAGSPDPDVGVTARAVHHASREATAELRRRLGLLREEPPDPRSGGEPSDEGGDPTSGARGKERPVRSVRGILIVTAVVLLAAVESLVYPLLEGDPPRWASVAASVLAAASLVWLRVDPAISAVVCAAVWGQSALTGIAVVGGFWVIATLGPIAYALVTRGEGWRAGAAGVVLVAGVVTGTLATDPDNTGVDLVAIGVGAVAGAAVRLARARAAAARRVRDTRELAVRPALEAALRHQRGVMARELHDTVSHAVGVVAMQAAAAEVSWPARPDRAREALDLATSTASAALAELDAVGAGEEAPVTSLALVARFRTAGLDVDARIPELSVAVEPLVARIIQESLTNVVRHSGAAAARVDVETTDGQVKVVVADEGTGGGETHPGFGLTGLRERVELAGGILTASPRHPRGFAVVAEFPMPDVEVGA